VPVDSEHSAVLQCTAGRGRSELARLILTASGGPFRTWAPERIAAATVAEALRHPTWKMGKKITVDSATLVNKALEVIEAHFLFGLGYDAVDINLGCPAKKVVKCGGSGLLRDLPLLEQIFRSVRAAVKIPLTIKLRAGWDEKSIVAVDVAKLAESVGVEAVAVHPRTRVQGYAGAADWSIIAAVKQAVKIPVIGNGDINRPEDAARMFSETGCDAVMIGRAAATNPWIFRQMEEFAESGRYTTPTETDRHRLLMDYYQQIYAANLPDGVGKMKQFACWFTHSVGNGSELRRIVHAARTPGEILSSVEGFFEGRAGAVRAQEMAGPTPVGASRSEDLAHGPSQHLGCEATLGT